MRKLYPKGYEPQADPEEEKEVRNALLNAILLPRKEETALDTDIFHVMAKRRSTRKFDMSRKVVFCMNPERVKLDFPADILAKFSLQDATLAAAYSQLAASALGLSSIWIGMIDEKMVQEIVGTDLRPSSLLCIGYPLHKKQPKSRRNLKELIHVV